MSNEHGCTWFYMVLHGSTWFYMVVLGYTWFYMVVHGCTWLYMVVHGCTWLYMVVHRCTWLYMVVHGCTCSQYHEMTLYNEQRKEDKAAEHKSFSQEVWHKFGQPPNSSPFFAVPGSLGKDNGVF